MRKKQITERKVIQDSPTRRPYGAKLTLILEEDTKFPIDGPCELLISTDHIIRISPRIDEKNTSHQIWDIFVEGFATACEAEQAGLRAALGFFWSAVQGHYSIRLHYHTPLPCMVYDRNKRSGLQLTDSVSLTVVKGLNNIITPLDHVLKKDGAVDHRLLLAIELFASARLETTERARFIGLVSSLEPIAIQDSIENDEFIRLIDEYKKRVSSLDLDKSLRDSLIGRINQLKKESIGRSIQKLVLRCLPDDPVSMEIIKEAYNIRSQILHNGSTDADLSQKTNQVETVIRKIIECLISTHLN